MNKDLYIATTAAVPSLPDDGSSEGTRPFRHHSQLSSDGNSAGRDFSAERAGHRETHPVRFLEAHWKASHARWEPGARSPPMVRRHDIFPFPPNRPADRMTAPDDNRYQINRNGAIRTITSSRTMRPTVHRVTSPYCTAHRVSNTSLSCRTAIYLARARNVSVCPSPAWTSLCGVQPLRTLTTWHCPHFARRRCYAPRSNRSVSPAGRDTAAKVCCCGTMLGQTDGRTDRRTPYRFILCAKCR